MGRLVGVDSILAVGAGNVTTVRHGQNALTQNLWVADPDIYLTNSCSRWARSDP